MPEKKSPNIADRPAPKVGGKDVEPQARNSLTIRLKGSWKIGKRMPSAEDVEHMIQSKQQLKRVAFDAHQLTGWDSGLLTFLIRVKEQCSKSNIDVDPAGLPSRGGGYRAADGQLHDRCGEHGRGK